MTVYLQATMGLRKPNSGWDLGMPKQTKEARTSNQMQIINIQLQKKFQHHPLTFYVKCRAPLRKGSLWEKQAVGANGNSPTRRMKEKEKEKEREGGS